MTTLETQRQISAREYLILSYKDKINRIQDSIDILETEIKKLKEEVEEWWLE